MNERVSLKAGDWVEVLPVSDLLTTLDGYGQLEGLPFMPEMMAYCGRPLQITAVIEKICAGGGRGGMRAVKGAPVLVLGELRCDGSSHDGCSRLCTLLWKAKWLTLVDSSSPEAAKERSGTVAVWPYPTRTDSGAYRCQATALYQATRPMPDPEKLRRAITDVATGEWGLLAFLRVYARLVGYRVRSLGRRIGRRVQRLGPTPTQDLDLKPGEWVETKSARQIAATLNRSHANRGLGFSDYMKPYCGRKYRVKARVGKFIDQHTGNMRELKHTVILEGIACGGETTAGVCQWAEYLLWREIWLKRAEDPGERQQHKR